MSRSRVLAVLGDHVFAVHDILMNAWDWYCALPVEQRVIISPCTRALMVHDHVVNAARATFGDAAHTVNGLFLVYFDGFVIRFKKLNEQRQSSKGRTIQDACYIRQEPIPDLLEQLGLSAEPTHLDAGYLLDPMQIAVQSAWLICPSGLGVPAWEHRLVAKSAGKDPTSFDSIMVPEPQANVTAKDEVVVKIKQDKTA